jgi:hypothetical protein
MSILTAGSNSLQTLPLWLDDRLRDLTQVLVCLYQKKYSGRKPREKLKLVIQLDPKPDRFGKSNSSNS